MPCLHPVAICGEFTMYGYIFVAVLKNQSEPFSYLYFFYF